ncbi:Uncharacterised protein [Sphingobacterium mizutaii]|uniref:Uncharacterized protein n=1 Tax=Sphingobacterium mizutaii TaxID=1010 RepID=A0AAJ4XDK0_9SPHI|nr:hypothetical protein SAMN05192578_1011525 [Sphingobacterium mizutaii]SNV52211.1 Uncharacterised protein [Sphingobacterium mizutaii]
MPKRKLTLKAYLTVKRQDLFAHKSANISVRETWKILRNYFINK